MLLVLIPLTTGLNYYPSLRISLTNQGLLEGVTNFLKIEKAGPLIAVIPTTRHIH